MCMAGNKKILTFNRLASKKPINNELPEDIELENFRNKYKEKHPELIALMDKRDRHLKDALKHLEDLKKGFSPIVLD